MIGSTTPGSPGPAASISSLSIHSPGNSPQLCSPGVISGHHQMIPTQFGFNSGMIGGASGFLSTSPSIGSPGAVSMIPPPPSPCLSIPSQSPPPLPPRNQRKNCSTPQQV